MGEPECRRNWRTILNVVEWGVMDVNVTVRVAEVGRECDEANEGSTRFQEEVPLLPRERPNVPELVERCRASKIVRLDIDVHGITGSTSHADGDPAEGQRIGRVDVLGHQLPAILGQKPNFDPRELGGSIPIATGGVKHRTARRRTGLGLGLGLGLPEYLYIGPRCVSTNALQKPS